MKQEHQHSEIHGSTATPAQQLRLVQECGAWSRSSYIAKEVDGAEIQRIQLTSLSGRDNSDRWVLSAQGLLLLYPQQYSTHLSFPARQVDSILLDR